jgi:hypothetical protein
MMPEGVPDGNADTEIREPARTRYVKGANPTPER